VPGLREQEKGREKTNVQKISFDLWVSSRACNHIKEEQGKKRERAELNRINKVAAAGNRCRELEFSGESDTKEEPGDSLCHMLTRPERNEYGDWYVDYVARVPPGDVIDVLEKQSKEMLAFLKTLSEEQAEQPPAPGKWSVKQVIGHLCDGERVFTYRALRFSRGDQTPLPGFEQDDYVRESHANERKLADLAAEYEALRKATIAFFKSLSPETALRRGSASNAEVSVRALAYITAGHEQRHLELMKKQFGI